VCDYPPLYLIVLRAASWLGAGMLPTGRAIEILATLATCALIGSCVFRTCRLSCRRQTALLAACIAGVLPLSLLPVISWSILMRVDCLALALTFGGIFLSLLSFRHKTLIYPALVLFVAAAFTKQSFLAGAIAMFPICLLRAPKPTLKAYSAGFALGVALIGVMQWATEGRFLRHIVVYAADTASPAIAFRLSMHWVVSYPVFVALALCALGLAWRRMRGLRGAVTAIREDEEAAWLGFLWLYLLITTAMLITAGKTGSAQNYFLEWMCCWCLLIGWLCGQALERFSSPILAGVIPLLMFLQLIPVQSGLVALRTGQFSEKRKAEWGALLAAVKKIPGPLLSDDMVLVIQAGREVRLEPGILLEMAHTGKWDERQLIDRLRSHYFGAVITAYDPGDPIFDARYLPATQQAMLSAYPVVQNFGDYRLRLP
jgi:hypothetical protein